MHMPRQKLWQEMLSVPQLVRFTFPFQDGDERYPTLIIKAHSLLLKYIVQGVPLTLHFFATSDNRCAYALHIADDPKNGVLLWSLLADDDEISAIKDLRKHGGCSVYIFNEACANCAWTSAKINITDAVSALIDASPCDDPNPADYASVVGAILDNLVDGATTSKVLPDTEWKPLHSTFITNGVRSASLNLLFDNEGTYQEQLAHALLGDLSPRGAFLNTKIVEPSGSKEFTDLVLTHEFGTILLESKALSIFEQRVTLPTREKLKKNIKKAANKAFNQLKGASRTLRDNIPVLDEHGSVIELERQQPIHAIILVPELELLPDPDQEWLKRIAEFMEASGGFLHVLDTVALFRMMQAAQMIAEKSLHVTPMMAFDYYLIERAKIATKNHSINFDILLRFA